MTVWAEYALSALAFAILAVYHLRLYRRVHHAPLSTALGFNLHTRRAWVETVMEDHNRDLLAVQTLRNWGMAASFLASTAILLGLGMINIAFNSALSGVSQAVHTMNDQEGGLWTFKIILLVCDFFFAFFNFTLAIRAYNRVGFIITIPRERDPLVTPELVSKVLGDAMLHYSLGMRGYYLAVPFTLWLFGPQWGLIGAVVMVYVMQKIDYHAD